MTEKVLTDKHRAEAWARVLQLYREYESDPLVSAREFAEMVGLVVFETEDDR